LGIVVVIIASVAVLVLLVCTAARVASRPQIRAPDTVNPLSEFGPGEISMGRKSREHEQGAESREIAMGRLGSRKSAQAAKNDPRANLGPDLPGRWTTSVTL
jgi:hypothetical protein